MRKSTLRFILCGALIIFACWVVWLCARAAGPMKVTITYLGTVTNTSTTYTTTEGTIPVTAATSLAGGRHRL